MKEFTFADIEKFIMDDAFFHWAKYGSEDSDFDINAYKAKFPGEEKKIEAAIAMIKHSTINKDKSLYSRPYKMRNLSRIFDKNNEQQKQLKRKRVYKYIVGVAAVLILCVLPAYYLLFYTSTSLNDEFAMIEPCANDTSGQVQIFMGDEQSISLDKTNPNITVEKDGSISVDNVQVAKVDNEKLTTNQIVVPYGKRSRITLPDGSLLWINSGSRIAYKSDFSTNRKLTISGEIYLDVKRDVHHPFIVKSSRMEVEVLGTAFNVSDYEDNAESAVVLVRGSVDVKADNGSETRLVPNQKMGLSQGKMKVKNVDVYEYICWKDDIINFDGKTMPYILNTLSKYYNVNIEGIENVSNEVCYGNLDLNRSIDEVLEYISLTVPLQFHHEGNSIIVSSK